ncbi:hypothetical protein ABPG72_004514 [Tetrahymena utriculariae]
MSGFQTLKSSIPQYPQYQIPQRNQTASFSVADRYNVSFSTPSSICSQQKSKGGLPCKKDKKHQSFDLIFICLEKDCPSNLKPICAQCLHEEHSGHEIKLIKEIAEIANNFISQERRKKKISPYWEQLSEQYTLLYDQIESIVTHLQNFQNTLKKSNDEFFSKLNNEKNEFWDTVETASQKILSEKYTSEDDLFQKIRTILKNVKIEDPSNPQYRFNILKEETVLLVMQNYKEIEALVNQTKEFTLKTLIGYQIKESYQAQEFKIIDGDDYMKISTIDNRSKSEKSCIVEVEDKEDEVQQNCEMEENFDDDEEDLSSSNLDTYSNKINKIYITSDQKDTKNQQESHLNESDDFDLIGEDKPVQKKQDQRENVSQQKLPKETKIILENQPKLSQLPKIASNRLYEKPSSQEIRMKYAADFSTQFWNQQPTQQQQSTITHSSYQSNNINNLTGLRKKDFLNFDDLNQNSDYQYQSDFFSRYTTNTDELFKNNDQSLQNNSIGNNINQLSNISRQMRPLPPPNNLQIQNFVNPYQKM